MALAGIVATSTGVLANYRRTKRRETIDAWNASKTASADARRANFATFGSHNLTSTQARALITGHGEVKDRHGVLLTVQARKTAVNNLSFVLNGLEGLAVGTYLGAYDVKILSALGSTIIRQTMRRYETYIVGRQKAEDADRQQSSAFQALCVLTEQLETLAKRKTGLQASRNRLSYLRGL